MADSSPPDFYWNPRTTPEINAKVKGRDTILMSLISLVRLIRTIIFHPNSFMPIDPAIREKLEEFHIFFSETLTLLFQARLSFIEPGIYRLPSRALTGQTLNSHYIPNHPYIEVRSDEVPSLMEPAFMQCVDAIGKLKPINSFETNINIGMLLASLTDAITKDHVPQTGRTSCFSCLSVDHPSTHCTLGDIDECSDCGEDHPSDVHFPPGCRSSSTILALLDHKISDVVPDEIPSPSNSPTGSLHSSSSNESPATPPMEPNPNNRLSPPPRSPSPPWSPQSPPQQPPIPIAVVLPIRRYPPYPRYDRSHLSPPPLRRPFPINEPMLPAAPQRQIPPNDPRPRHVRINPLPRRAPSPPPSPPPRRRRAHAAQRFQPRFLNRPIICYFCLLPHHIARNCPYRLRRDNIRPYYRRQRR